MLRLWHSNTFFLYQCYNVRVYPNDSLMVAIITHVLRVCNYVHVWLVGSVAKAGWCNIHDVYMRIVTLQVLSAFPGRQSLELFSWEWICWWEYITGAVFDSHMHTYTHTPTYMHMYIHTYTHTHTYVHTHISPDSLGRIISLLHYHPAIVPQMGCALVCVCVSVWVCC